MHKVVDLQQFEASDAALPGFGVVTQDQRSDWAGALAMLPPSISNDPNSQFCNPNLAAALSSFLKQHCDTLGVKQISESQYLELLEDGISPKRVAAFLSRINRTLALREDNPYHGGFHSRSEVPQRLQTILQNISQSEIDQGTLGRDFSRAILYAAAPTHDLFHAGVGYAQRLTPGLNISNEERAVMRMVEIAFDAGFNPVQVFEMQRVILPTCFFQKPEQLGLTKSPLERVPYLQLEGLPASSFPKLFLAREYDPDISAFSPTRKMAQILALADVCVTLGSMENWIDRSLAYYIEVKVGQGNFPTTIQDLVQDELQFLTEHVASRLEACKEFISRDFYSDQMHTINSYAERLVLALRYPDSDDGKMLGAALFTLTNFKVTSGPILAGLMDLE